MVVAIRVFAVIFLVAAIFLAPCVYSQCPKGDLNDDCQVDMLDLGVVAQYWMTDDSAVRLDNSQQVSFGDLMVLARNWLDAGSMLIISEFLASNGNIVFDEDGDSSDWIEIFNPTSFTVNLNGWHLTDDEENLSKWTFGDVNIGAGEYLIVYASNKDRKNPEGELHTNFILSAVGDYLGLVKPDGESVVTSFSPFPRQYSNVSYGISQIAGDEILLSRISEAKLLVPQNADDLPSEWQAKDFADENWDDAVIGVGFDTVLGPGTDVHNVALAKPAQQSSIGFEYGAQLAVDGDFQTFTHTINTDNNATWQVDLQGGNYISRIILHNRANCCQSRLRDITVTIRDEEDTVDLFVSDLLNPENVLNSPTYITVDLVELTGSVLLGGIVKVHRTPDPDLSGSDGEGNDDEATVLSLAEVEVFASEVPETFEHLIETDLYDEMVGISPSVFLRIPFQGSNVHKYGLLNLNVKYDDGFVAYLNGTKVASRNAPTLPQWNSTAISQRAKEQATVAETINLTQYLDLLKEGQNILSVHGLNFEVNDEDFLVDVELAVSESTFGKMQYMKEATPGADNAEGYSGAVGDTKFSHDRGFYDQPFNVEITSETDGAIIYYTTDGSTPSETNGAVYSDLVQITKTTCLRAIALKQDYLPANVDTQTYIFLDGVIDQPSYPQGFPTSWGGTGADYQMDPDITDNPSYSAQMRQSLLSLPTMSIVTETDNLFDAGYGIYSNPQSHAYELADGTVMWEAPASVEYFDPGTDKEFQIDCGLRIQGGYFRNNNASRKHSFRLLFKRMYGPAKLEFPFFDYDKNAADRFDTIVLRGAGNDGYTWGAMGTTTQYTRDEFGRSLQLDTGNAASHGIFVHLYVNGLYWGLYNPCERPDDAFNESYYGGNKEDWDVFKHKNFAVNEGNKNALNQMLALCQTAASSDDDYQKLQGNNPDGTPNPQYPDLLDIDNFIDYMLVNMWAGNWDWPWNNYWLGRNRTAGSTGFKFFCWDIEDIVHSPRSPLTMDKVTGGNTDQAGQPHGSLRQNDEYKMLFADHVQRYFFNWGIMAPDSLIARYSGICDEIELAMISESARWGDMHRSTPYSLAEWRNERDYILNTYLVQRSDIVLEQLKTAGLYPYLAASEFKIEGSHQHGGYVSTGDNLSLTSTSVSSSTVTLIDKGSVWSYLDKGTDEGTAWREKDFPDGSWDFGAAELGYSDSPVTTVSYGPDSRNKYATTYFRHHFNIEDPSIYTKLVLNIQRDDGAIVYLNGHELGRSNIAGGDIYYDTYIGNSVGGGAENTFYPISMNDSEVSHLVAGDNVIAVEMHQSGGGSSDLSFDLELKAGVEGTVISNDVWYTVDGSDPRRFGGSRDPDALQYSSPLTLTESLHIKARRFDNGDWSALNEAVFAVGPVAENLRVTEVMYHPADPNHEYVELQNVGTESINLNLVRLTKGVDFTFGSIDLLADEFVLVVRNEAEFMQNYPEFDGTIAGQFEGSLDNNGEKIRLRDALNETIVEFDYQDGWFDITDGAGFSLTIKDAYGTEPNEWDSKSGWRPSAAVGGSPGFDDLGIVPPLGAVVINEVIAHSHALDPDWIELYNTTDQLIPLGGWFLSDSSANLKKYEIAADVAIEPYGYVVFIESDHFGNVNDPGCSVPFALSENGDEVYLHSGQNGELTGYNEEEDFGASETGVSFGRYQKSTGTWNFVSMSSPTRGQRNSYPKVGPVVITEIMYNPAGNADAEYVEIMNIENYEVKLYDELTGESWKLEDDGGFELFIPYGTSISPGERIILAKNKTVLAGEFANIPAGTKIFEWESGSLSNGSEKIQLSKPGDVDIDGNRYYIRVDRVIYDDNNGWPTEPDGTGESLERINNSNYGNDIINWQSATPTPGN